MKLIVLCGICGAEELGQRGQCQGNHGGSVNGGGAPRRRSSQHLQLFLFPPPPDPRLSNCSRLTLLPPLPTRGSHFPPLSLSPTKLRWKILILLLSKPT